MAKSKSPATESATSEPQASSITISGLTFPVPTPYAEGHVLTAPEAATLNQTLSENLRNNFSTKVKKAKDAAVAAGTDLDESAIQAEFAAYAAEYKFNGIRQSRGPVDPILREATKIAKSVVTSALKAKNIDLKTLKEGQLDSLVEGLLAKKPEYMEEARRRVEATKAVAGDVLGDLGL